MAQSPMDPMPPQPNWQDTVVLPGSTGWQDTVVLLPSPVTAAPGWYFDPYDASRMRYWDGSSWTSHCSDASWFGGAGVQPRRPRRSVLLGFVLAFFFGGLALPYALPLPWWVRLLAAVVLAFALGWWLLLFIPLTWPFALILVPALTAALNPRR